MSKHFLHPKLWGLAVLWALAPLLAPAQAELTLAQALEKSRVHSLQLRIDSVTYTIAQSQTTQAKNNLLPQVNVNASYLRLSDNITPFTVAFPTGNLVLNPQILDQSFNSVQVRQLIWSGGKLRLAQDIQMLNAEASLAEIKKSKYDLAFLVTTLWYNLYMVQQTAEMVALNIGLLEQQRTDAANLVKQGTLLENEVLKIELGIAALQSNLAAINHSRRQLAYNLALQMGQDPEMEMVLPKELPSANLDASTRESFVTKALTQRSELAQWTLRQKQAAIGQKMARANYLPQLSTAGTVNYDRPNFRLFPNEARFTGTWTLGLFLTWNLADLYTNREKVAEANANLWRTQEQSSLVQEGIKMEVASNYSQYLQTLEQEKIAAASIPLAQENFRIEQNRFKNSTATSTDFLNANNALLQARLNLVTARANTQLAYARLLKATHTPLPFQTTDQP